MSEQIRNQYNSLYEMQGRAFREGFPAKLVQRLPNYLDGGSVLDIGAGQGANSLYLAEQGFEVTATDVSEVGLSQMCAAAEAAGLDIRTITGDINEIGIENMYEAMVCTFTLHHLNADDAKSLIEEAKVHTTPHGVHAIVVFANTGGLYERAKHSERFYPSREEIRDLYIDWELAELSTFETESLAKDKNGQPLRNQVISMIAINRPAR